MACIEIAIQLEKKNKNNHNVCVFVIGFLMFSLLLRSDYKNEYEKMANVHIFARWKIQWIFFLSSNNSNWFIDKPIIIWNSILTLRHQSNQLDEVSLNYRFSLCVCLFCVCVYFFILFFACECLVLVFAIWFHILRA